MIKQNTKKKEMRPDDPLVMYRIYLNQLSSFSNLLDKLFHFSGITEDIISTVFDLVWAYIKSAILKLEQGAIIGYKKEDSSICYYAATDKSVISEKRLIISDDSKEAIALNSASESELEFWNYYNKAPNFYLTKPEKHAFCLFLMCKLPSDENLFLILSRDIEKRPFLDYELLAIKVIAKNLGLFFNNLFYSHVHNHILYKKSKEASVNE